MEREWDPIPIHTEKDAARETIFGDIVASTVHLFAIATKLSRSSKEEWAVVSSLIRIMKYFSSLVVPRYIDLESDKNEALPYVEENAFGELISTVNGRLFSTHMPFILNENKSRLIGHFAKKNPQWEQIADQEVLAIFMATPDYVSPQWYQSPGVPTWNYQAVHNYGQCTTFSSPEKLESLLVNLTNEYESVQPHPCRLEFNETMLGAIIGIEIDILEIQCKYKLSQNRSAQDRASVITQLANQCSARLAKAMKDDEL